jgi:hypothetical protein
MCYNGACGTFTDDAGNALPDQEAARKAFEAKMGAQTPDNSREGKLLLARLLLALMDDQAKIGHIATTMVEKFLFFADMGVEKENIMIGTATALRGGILAVDDEKQEEIRAKIIALLSAPKTPEEVEIEREGKAARPEA